MSSRAKLAAAAAALGLVLAAGWFVAWRGGDEPPAGVRELGRSQLELRDGRLYAVGEPEAFGGMLVEHFPGGGRRLAIEIHDGKAHGVSRGWHENGRLEVEEHFVRGVSHGSRIRWYPNGVRKSEAQIVEGVIEGTFTRWHDNGRKAAVAIMVHGVPHGVSEAWDASGNPKSRVLLESGKVVGKEYFK